MADRQLVTRTAAEHNQQTALSHAALVNKVSRVTAGSAMGHARVRFPASA